jgi:single-stranded-DNA-specific exonuclease
MRWTLKPKPDKAHVAKLVQALNVAPFIAELLVSRGVDNFDQAKSFFRPTLSELHNPFLMKDMDKAVFRIQKAIANNENILIFGDYDVDGTTAVALVSSYFNSFYPNVATYIPDRYLEGYGISYQGIDFADDNDFSLIIALDCGIKSVSHVAYATEKNIDFIICDHHRPGAELPNAIAVLDPQRDDCQYPYKELCGCGVGFKLIQAFGVTQNQTIDDLIGYLDLVATAIGADIVPITGENRILAYYGLRVINHNPRPGIKALIHQIKKQVLTITDVVFIIAPRINAAGRIKHGDNAVSLLTETDFEKAVAFATEIEQFNSDRKELDKKITQEALQQIIQNKEETNYTTVVFQPDWHKGVIGIVASRLTETYYRPTLVFTQNGATYAASARSVSGFDVYQALENCADYLQQFGGHKYAAGMTLLPENYEAFKMAFENEVKKSIPEECLTPELQIDAAIELSDISPKMFRILQQFEPFGPGNRTPIFLTKQLFDTGFAKPLGQNGEHLKLFVKQNNTQGFAAIGFGLGAKYNLVMNLEPFDALYSLDENEWNGQKSIQLRIKDIK